MHLPQRFSAYKKTLTGVTVLFLFSAAVTLATPPTSPYDAGDTLDPGCAPGDTNCSVALISAIYTDGTTMLGAGTVDDPLSAIGLGDGTDTSVLAALVATTAILPGSPTYSNGTAGVGATLTRGSDGTLGTIDGISSFTVGDRLLIKTQVATLQNGIYEITQVGSVSTPYILTRTEDSDEPSELDSQIVSVASGTQNKKKLWAQQTDTPTIGTNEITYQQTTGVYTTQQTTGTQATGQIAFWTGKARQLSKGESNLFWDNTNNRLGVGTNVPAYQLDVAGYAQFQSVTFFQDTPFLFNATARPKLIFKNDDGETVTPSDGALLAGSASGGALLFGNNFSSSAVTDRYLKLGHIDNNESFSSYITLTSTSSVPYITLDAAFRAGTTTHAPLKFTAGTNLTTPENGAMEYDGTHLYFTTGSTRYQIDQQIAFSGAALLGSANIFTTNGAVSTPANTFNGTWYSGGTTTTTKPYLLIEPTGTTSTLWSTAGTGFGINAASAFTGNLIDTQVNGSSKFNVTYTGALTASSVTANSFSILNGNGITGGTATFTSTASLGRIYTNASSVHAGNLTVVNSADTGGAGGQSTYVSTASQLLFAGASSVAARVSIRGSTTLDMSALYSTAGVNHSYTAFGIGTMTVKLAASGTHALLAQQVIKPLTVTTNGTSVVTNTTSLYIEGASTATVTGSNYSLWADDGLVRFDGNTSIGKNAAPTTYTLEVGNSSVVGIVARFENSTGTCDINPTTTSLSCSSDERLKKNIVELAVGASSDVFSETVDTENEGRQGDFDVVGETILDKVLNLRPVTYNWNSEDDTDPVHIGFIAQEVEDVFPDLVATDEITSLKSLNYIGLIPYTIAALQDVNIKITDIENLTENKSFVTNLVAWLANAENRISRIFTGEICLSEAGEEPECLNREELRDLKQLLNTPQNPPIVPDPEPEVPPADEEIVPVEEVQNPEEPPSETVPEIEEEPTLTEVADTPLEEVAAPVEVTPEE